MEAKDTTKVLAEAIVAKTPAPLRPKLGVAESTSYTRIVHDKMSRTGFHGDRDLPPL